jgi:Coiled-coil domain-containing protein 55 (DUF2040)
MSSSTQSTSGLLRVQAEEELFDGKERFATAAYKRKLAEDKAFAEQLAARCALSSLLCAVCAQAALRISSSNRN